VRRFTEPARSILRKLAQGPDERRVKGLSNPYNECMKTNIVDHGDVKTNPKTEIKTRPKWPALLLVLLSVAMAAGGCTDYYASSPAYGPGYAGYGPYGTGYGYGRPYGPGYVGYPGYGPGAVTVEVGDRPYYTHGPGYYVGRTYYVWRPGHWGWRNGNRIWIRGHYVIRG
jgi:hypothetical protein